MLMPNGEQGYGLFDYNHIRQFWTLTQQNKENEHLAIMQAMQDEKKMLLDRIKELENSQKESSHKGAWQMVEGDSPGEGTAKSGKPAEGDDDMAFGESEKESLEKKCER